MRNFRPSGPQRIAGYEDIIDDAVQELERVNSRIVAARLQYQMLQRVIRQGELQTHALRETTLQVQQMRAAITRGFS